MKQGGTEKLGGWRAIQRRRLDVALPGLGYHCLHDAVHPQGATGRMDHLVTGPAGSFLITDVHCADEVRKGFDGRVWCAGHPLEADLDRVHTAAAEVAAVLGSHVSAVLAVHEGEVKTPPVVRGVYLVPGTEVIPLIEARPPHRSPAEVAQVAARARVMLRGGDWVQALRSGGGVERPEGGTAGRAATRSGGWRSRFSDR